VAIGRPYIWGLASFGQDVVEAALKILTTELHMTMQQLGATSIEGITKNFVVDRARY
jgi:isopentenyl diphosphate isomerase/L-lactate dehydrogenase-like FMN-dependent dehydrogenase